MQNADALHAEETNFDFGTISMAAGKVMHGFTIKNTGTKPVTIQTIVTSCMCTSAVLKKGDSMFGPYGMPGHGFTLPVNQMFAAGEEATLEVTFDPAAHGPAGIGRIARTVTLTQDNGRSIEFRFNVLVTP